MKWTVLRILGLKVSGLSLESLPGSVELDLESVYRHQLPQKSGWTLIKMIGLCCNLGEGKRSLGSEASIATIADV